MNQKGFWGEFIESFVETFVDTLTGDDNYED